MEKEPAIPIWLEQAVARRDRLDRRHLRLLCRSLRRRSWSYREISNATGVPMGTLSPWLRDIEVDRAAIVQRTRPNVGVRTRPGRKRREEIARIRSAARNEVTRRIGDPLWLLGVALYWGEGSKRSNCVELANSDLRIILVFLTWLENLGIDRSTDVRVQLHLHSGQDPEALIRWWSNETGIPRSCFIKPFIKPEGTGHRTNRLYYGTVRIYVRRSTDLFHTVMGWIEGLGALPILVGGSLAQLGRAGRS